MKYFIVPIVASIIVHLIKILLDIAKSRFSWNRVLGYGGMPSAHSALVSSLATTAYLLEGFSFSFAICLILALLVIRDALGLRGYLSIHGRILNKLIKDLPDEEEYKYPVMEETIAHSFWQIVVGALLGIVITFLIF